MLPSDRRERDKFEKHLRRRPVDPLAPPKPTSRQLLEQIVAGVRDEYDHDAETRASLGRDLFNERKEP